jgi:hypothetical protein
MSKSRFSWFTAFLTVAIVSIVLSLIMYFAVGRGAPQPNIMFMTNLFFTVGIMLLILAFAARFTLVQIELRLATASEQTLRQIEHNVSGAITEALSKTMEMSQLAKDSDQIGLVAVMNDASKYDYSEILIDSRQLTVVLNDGRTWASVHRDQLRRRFEDSSKETTFILCHPDSAMIQVLARKGSTDVETIRARIKETVTLLEEIIQPETKLEILGHHVFNPYSLILGDDSAVVIPYFLSRGGRRVPLWKIRKTKTNGFFRDLSDDVQRLRMDTKAIGSDARLISAETVIRFKSS